MDLTEIAHFTDDVPAMRAFYRRLLNADPIAESPDMAIFAVGQTKILIHRTYTPGEGDLPPEGHIAFTVPDVDDACRHLIERGLTVEVPPKDYNWGRSVYLRDPDGHLIEVNQATETPA